MLKKIVILLFVTCFACFSTVFAAESGGMPQLNPEFWISQIFWLIITFGILFIVLTKVILPKISDNLETRKSQILENIETADKQKEESQKKIDEYEKIILDSKLKAKSYFNEAREKILETARLGTGLLEEYAPAGSKAVVGEVVNYRGYNNNTYLDQLLRKYKIHPWPSILTVNSHSCYGFHRDQLNSIQNFSNNIYVQGNFENSE